MRLIIDRNFSGQPDKNERNGAPHVNVFELAFYWALQLARHLGSCYTLKVQKRVLVSSPHPAFRQLLRRSLEDSGRYLITLEPGLIKAAALAADPDCCDLAILDADACTPQEQAALLELQQARPALPIILFPPENDPRHPFLTNKRFAAVLSKPFYFPDLMMALDALPAAARPESGWTAENGGASATLSSLVAETAAQAGFILQGGRTLAQAGSLPGPAAEEVQLALARAWGQDRRSDLVRYLDLTSTRSDGLLYATPLAAGQALGLFFNKETSVRQARTITQLVAQAIGPQFVPVEPPPAAPAPAPPAQVEPSESELEWAEDEESAVPIEELNLKDLLAQVPAPDPQHEPAAERAGWQAEHEFQFPWEQSGAPGAEALADTSPSPNRGAVAAPAGGLPNGSNRQAYTCILLPRNAQTHLAGELAQFLRAWIPEFCLKFGWDLAGLSIDESYLQWTVQVPPAVSPGNLARMLRQQSSALLRQKFPLAVEESAPADFWAPGYLVVSGRQPPTPAMIHDYIQQTRRRHGAP